MQSTKTKLSRPFLIALAAFAVTATGVHAFSSPTLLMKAGLSDEQVVAVQEAQELKASGDFAAAQETLDAAGIDEETLKAIRELAHEAKRAIHDAIESGDYNAFVIAAEDSPLLEFITTEDEFEQFVEAHELRHAGEHEAAKELLDGLGIKPPEKGHHHNHRGGHVRQWSAVLEQLTEEQQAAIEVAKEANDRETVRAILEEAGVELPVRSGRMHR